MSDTKTIRAAELNPQDVIRITVMGGTEDVTIRQKWYNTAGRIMLFGGSSIMEFSDCVDPDQPVRLVVNV